MYYKYIHTYRHICSANALHKRWQWKTWANGSTF